MKKLKLQLNDALDKDLNLLLIRQHSPANIVKCCKYVPSSLVLHIRQDNSATFIVSL